MSTETSAAPLAFRLNRRSGEALWRQLLEDLRQRLDRGEFRAAFPGELEIRDDYGVSRHTVREALRQLRDDGVVVAGRGRAPRVATTDIEQPLGALYSLFASVEAAGFQQNNLVLGLDVRADAHVAIRLGLEESSPLLYLERLRLADGQPLAHEHVWLPAALARPLLEVDFGHTALYTELARRCHVRVTGGREQLRATNPRPRQRQLLQLDPETAAFSIERLGCSAGTPVEWRTTLIRGDRFSVVADFSPSSGYRLNLQGTTGPHLAPWPPNPVLANTEPAHP